MASLTANEEHIAGGMQVHKISGEVYVNVSALYERGPRPSFGNYYHYDVDEANDLRKNTAHGAQLERELLVDVDHCLRQINQFCQMYMRFHEVFQNAVRAREDEGRADEPLIRMRIVNISEASAADKGDVYPGRLNPATLGQVMAVFDAEDDEAPPDPCSRGTWVYLRKTRSPRPLPHWNPDACPLLFPMLLPNGQRFYTTGIPVAKATKGRTTAKRNSTADDHTMVEDNLCSDDDNTRRMDDGRKQQSFVSHHEFALYHYAYRAPDKPH
ncbi:unnamed protein product [Toxocara canis]|uniref:Helitron helicase n=1 Tax=Toxocara canis TaxID=6265 RepID=A0A183TX07_TOXCA|nr:unnamed protein product [Toxocara canis]